MGNIFGKKPKAPQPMPAAPRIDDGEVQRKAAEERKRRQLAQGRASTMLTGGQGATDEYMVNRNNILGG